VIFTSWGQCFSALGFFQSLTRLGDRKDIQSVKNVCHLSNKGSQQVKTEMELGDPGLLGKQPIKWRCYID